jgi:hypothetical protein
MELTGGGITSKNENPYAREKKNETENDRKCYIG